MNVEIDSKQYAISEEAFKALLHVFGSKAIEMYEAAPSLYQALLMQGARSWLYSVEKKLMDSGNTELALLMRPPKKGDPVLHVITILLSNIEEYLKNGKICLTTDSYHTIVSLAYQSESFDTGGRQLVDLGEKRKRKNNSRKNAAQSSFPTLSH